MNLDEYQTEAITTAIYANNCEDLGLHYCLLQLSSEAGEAAGKLAKAMRKGTEVDVTALAYELGDVLWYVANAANEIGYSLSEIADMNITKLTSRVERGVINGDGDNR